VADTVYTTTPSVTRAIVLCPDIYQKSSEQSDLLARTPEQSLEEAVSLAYAISHLEVIHFDTIRVREIKPGTLFGLGIVEEIKILIEDLEINLVIINQTLSPIQQRNLEEKWNCKVIDRTGLILEIFGERAQTKEGSLQVELAALTYQRSRLVRSWTHLERQRGGFGFLGGPGESQLEIDRRMIDNRIAHLKKKLESVKRTRGLHRKKRQKVPYPIVALVGYTNAGKSTLFNRLTKSDVMAENLLFATLDPTMRKIKLPSGRDVILSDTVGFISDLPTQLVAAFRATLEEVREADILIHVRDISHPQTEIQAQDVQQVLKELGLENMLEDSTIEALNKIDQLKSPEIPPLEMAVPISALKGDGITELLETLEKSLAKRSTEYKLILKSEEGKALAWLYTHGEILKRQDKDDQISLNVRLSEEDRNRYKRLFEQPSS